VLARGSRRPHLWVAYAVVGAASVYFHASCALVLVAHAATLLFGQRPTRRAVGFTTATAALATPAVVAVLASRRHVLDPLVQPGLGDVARAVHDASGRNVLLLAAAAAGLGWLIHAATSGREADSLALLGVWTVTPVAAALALSIVRPSLDSRYLAVCTPALALLGGVGLIRIPRREPAVAALVAILALSGVRLAQLDRRTIEDWPAAVAYATNAKKTGDRIVIAPRRALSAFAYYAGPGRGSLAARGATALVVVRAADETTALKTARSAVHVPAYALRGERRFGRHLWVQEWDRTGVAPG